MIGCLCLHGFTGGPYEIEPLTEYLEENTDWLISVPTLPGHGIDLELDEVTHQDWLDKADLAYRELAEKVDQVYLIGFSMGGMIAAALAAKYDATRLVMLSPSRKFLSLPGLTLELGQLIKDRIYGEIEENLTYKTSQHKKGKIPPRAYIEFLKCMTATRPFLQDVTTPVLILQGIKDGLVPFQSTHDLAKEMPGENEVIYFSDSTHLICLGDDKEIVISATYDFLMKDEIKEVQASNDA